MKTSKVKKLVPKKLAEQLADKHAGQPDALHEALRRHGADTIGKMRKKGYELITCLESGEAVFTRDEQIVGLHIQLPEPLYERLSRECARRGTTKRKLVIDALEAALPQQGA